MTPPDLKNWKSKEFKNKTHYSPVKINGRTAIRAESNGSASGLYRELRIDLQKTPHLNWSWRADNVLKDVNEKSRTGDDYAARIYVIISGGFLFWQTRALSYVWSSNQPIGSSWPNAYTNRAIMVAKRSGEKHTNQWHHERVNLLKDLKRYFNKDYSHIDAVAIMTDTDNSGQSAIAYYGKIFFSE